ncbi:MAG: hypothetical protein OHK93_002112 [Ramalina farinacea]|uniref:FHA domain-containing protein n=1 Tax=Ramalina farinacea TaxID=258253 RepID=A0AA43U028_9LECA|nr:hypothetical protein [Ramalina farinacea]
MWVLECDGNCLNNKRIWLRPGRKYLFGRTKIDSPASSFAINHKSVSRQHLTITIASVKPGSGSNIRTRSELTIKDEDTKFQTELDGERIKGESRVLKNNEHVFKLGRATEKFTIKWEPVVFTFSLSAKETKASKDPLDGYRARLESLDVKVILAYDREATTHVIAGKRNTAKGLQALVNGKYIVTDAYVDKIVEAVAPTYLDSEESLSSLEEDFDANWPDPSSFLPAKSKEKTERAAKDFAPNPARESVFEGYTFVFCDVDQYETLHGPITNGGGKALHCELEPGQSTAEDIVRYVKSAAGEKGLGEFEDGSAGKGVVVVKFRAKGKYEEWAAGLDYEVAQALDHRLIEQSEFLDAILSNDASMLRRPLLPNEDDDTQAGGVNAATRTTSAANKHSSPPKMEDSSSHRYRAPIVSRFKGFEDDDDDDVDISMPASSAPAAKSQATIALHHSSFPGDDSDEVDMSQPPEETQEEKSRKRRAPSSDAEDAEDLMDRLAPTATKMKKRKLEMEKNGLSQLASFEEPETQTKPPKRTKAKQMNIKEIARQQKEAEEKAAKVEEEESLKDILDGMTVDQMKKLAVVEEMPLPERRTPARQADDASNPRWDERWNGRKNFKKFRRRGDGTQARRGHGVIVTLEEVKNKDYGIGDDYWLEKESEGAKRKRKEKERRTQSQSQQTQYVSAESNVAEVPSELVVNDGTNGAETIDVDAPRTTRHQDRTQQTQGSSGNTTKSSQAVTENHAARSQAPNAPAGPKKRKKFAAAKDSDNDSDEDNEVQPRYSKRAR